MSVFEFKFGRRLSPKLTELGELNRAGSGRASYYFRVK